MEINQNTRIFDLLENYPHLEHFLISLAPPFKNLKNPLLRKTVGKVATLNQVAKIGNLSTEFLVNSIRHAIGETEMLVINDNFGENKMEKPNWVSNQAKRVFDGNALMQAGINPLIELSGHVDNLADGEFITLITDFKPIPMIEKFQSKGLECYSEQVEDKFYTYYRR